MGARFGLTHPQRLRCFRNVHVLRYHGKSSDCLKVISGHPQWRWIAFLEHADTTAGARKDANYRQRAISCDSQKILDKSPHARYQL
jgi:hypothetical protein